MVLMHRSNFDGGGNGHTADVRTLWTQSVCFRLLQRPLKHDAQEYSQLEEICTTLISEGDPPIGYVCRVLT